MKQLIEKIERWNRFGIFVPCLALSVFVYYHLAFLFFTKTNASADSVLPDAFYFTQLVYRPEPFELIGYFLGFVVITAIALALTWLTSTLLERGYISEGFVKKWPQALLLSATAFLSYKIALHLFWFDLWKVVLPKGDLKLQGVLGLSLLVGFFVAWRGVDLGRFLAWLQNLPWEKIRPFLFLLIVVLVFSPNFPFDHHHYNDQLAPVNDLLRGKQFLSPHGTFTHYGFLNTLFLQGFFSFFPISYQLTSLVLSLVMIGWYFAWYYLIKKWLGSEIIAWLAVLAGVVFINTPQLNFDLIYDAPSNTPFHHLGMLLVAWLFLKLARSQRGEERKYENYILAASAIGFFWFVDTGLYLVAATLGVFAYLHLFSDKGWGNKLRSFLWQALKLGVMIAALGGAYSLWQYLRFGSFPDWGLLYFAADLYQRGYMMIPLPSHGYYFLFVFVYLGSLLYLMWSGYKGERLKANIFPLYITLFAILQFTYYITRSHTLNVTPRNIIFFAALLAWWWVMFSKRPDTGRYFVRAATPFLLVTLMFGAVYGTIKFWNTFNDRDYTALAQNFRAERIGQQQVYGGNADVLDDIAVLRDEFSADQERLAIVHWYDAKILFDLGKTNHFSIFFFPSIFYRSEMDAVIAQARETRPEFIFLGRKGSAGFAPFSDFADKLDYFYEGVADLYETHRQLQTMDVLRLRR